MTAVIIERKKYDAESVGESAYILFLRSRVFNEFSIKFKENWGSFLVDWSS